MPVDTQITIERLPQVLRRTGQCRSSLYKAIAEGTFPRPVPLSKRSVGFISSEIDEWIAQRIKKRQEILERSSHKHSKGGDL
jgi:prophage regulatory protein